MTGRTSGRTHGRIYVDIWAHMAEHDLSRDARQVYPYLLCQAKLSLCGAMDIRMRSWAKHLAITVEALDAALTELTECGWLFIDDDTEEMWVTGYIDREVNVRNRDTMKGALRAVNRVESPEIRRLAVEALSEKGGDVTLLDPKGEGSRSPDTPGDTPPAPPPARATAQPCGGPPAAAPRAPYQRPETLLTTSQPTGLTRAVDNSLDSGDQQLADQWIDAHVAHRRHRIRHPAALRRALHPAVTAVIHQAHDQSIDPRPLLAERWPIDNPDLWDGNTVDDLDGLGPPTDSPLTRFHRRLAEAGLWTTT